MLLLAALLAGAAEPPADTIQYRVTEALVVDKAGKPLFRAPRDFLLTISGNPEGRVIAYDAERRVVRVSEHNPWWIPCDQLRPLLNDRLDQIAIDCGHFAIAACPVIRQHAGQRQQAEGRQLANGIGPRRNSRQPDAEFRELFFAYAQSRKR